MIKVSKSCLSNIELNNVKKVLKKEYLGMGPEVKKFEEELKFFFNGRNVVCVNSGTAALHLALQACSISHGDEVLVPAITYVATFQAISATGAKPILCDINLNDLNISLASAKKRITKKTKAIVPVHFSGHPCDLDKIYKFAKLNKLRVIEDAAHAFGSYYKNKKIGSFGDVSCFSFDGIKNITAGEGGCIVSNDKKLIKKVSDSRLLGVINDSQNRYKNQRSWNFNVSEQGWRYHMSDINAAIGRAQLARFKNLSNLRKNICMAYDNIFLNYCDDVSIFKRNYKREVPHIYCILIKNLKKRDKLRQSLVKMKIQTGVHYVPGYKLDFYKINKKNFPIAESVCDKIITLPLHPDLTIPQTKYIGNSLVELLKKKLFY
jgi:dTDP-4-amino-4,6-dideoxygalactose transaminase